MGSNVRVGSISPSRHFLIAQRASSYDAIARSIASRTIHGVKRNEWFLREYHGPCLDGMEAAWLSHIAYCNRELARKG